MTISVYDALRIPKPIYQPSNAGETESKPEAKSKSLFYAVNITDMLGVDSPVKLLMHGVLTPEIVQAENDRGDGAAARLDCNDDRFEGILYIARLKYPKHKLRLYRSSTGNGGWERV